MAIHDAVHSLHRHLQTEAAQWRESNEIPTDLRLPSTTPILIDKGIRTIRVVSDNLTVLKWISGEYQMRHPNQKMLIDEIKWCTSIMTRAFGVRVVFQWTRSHTDQTLGNDMADELAGDARRLVDARRYKYDEWSFYHMRGVLNRCRRAFDCQMEETLRNSLKETKYGHIIKAEWERGLTALKKVKDKRHPGRATWDTGQCSGAGIPWTDFFKKEMQTVSRDVMRIIIGLRTGHNHLNLYMTELLKVKKDNTCFCGQQGQDFAHLLEDCDDFSLHRRRQALQARVKLLYLTAREIIKDTDPSAKILWNIDQLDFYNGLVYLYPPYDIPMDIRGQILHATADFYRWVMGYGRDRVTLERLVISHDQEDPETDSDVFGIG